MLTELLQQYNFSEREAKVYLTTLSLGSAPGSTIARYA
jgi:sugar-specific transcriptional regulator TrmB